MENNVQTMQGLGQCAVCKQLVKNRLRLVLVTAFVGKDNNALFRSSWKITPLSVLYILMPFMPIKCGAKIVVYKHKAAILRVKVQLERLCVSAWDATMKMLSWALILPRMPLHRLRLPAQEWDVFWFMTEQHLMGNLTIYTEGMSLPLVHKLNSHQGNEQLQRRSSWVCVWGFLFCTAVRWLS